MTAPTPEKAAPIPADDAVDTVAGILVSNAGRKYVISGDLELAAEIVEALADPEARPSLPDSRKERIREDERDRLYEATLRDRDVAQVARTPLAYRMASDTVSWLLGKGAMLPADRARARQGGNNG